MQHGALGNILVTEDTEGLQLILGKGVTGVTFESNLLSLFAGFQFTP
jgi:hypothetical protein